MGTQGPYAAGEEGIDLRELVNMLLRHKWMVLLCMAAAGIIAGVLTYVTLPPRYESSAVVALPIAGSDQLTAVLPSPAGRGQLEIQMAALIATGVTSGRLGMTPQGYQEVAASYQVMSGIARNIGREVDPNELGRRYRFQLDRDSRLLTVTTWANTQEQAFEQAIQWLDVFDHRVRTTIEGQFTGLKAAASHQVETVLPELTRSQSALDAFNVEHSISYMESRLASMEADLVNGERRLRELTRSFIPVEEARITALQEALSREPKTLNTLLGPEVALKITSPDGVTFDDVQTPNPIFLQLSQELAAASTSYAVARKEAEALGDSIASLTQEAQQLRQELLGLRATRDGLVRDVQRLEEVYEPANLQLGSLAAVENRLQELSTVRVISSASLPTTPAPRPVVRNLVLGLALGTLAGVGVAFFLDVYNRPPQAARPRSGDGSA